MNTFQGMQIVESLHMTESYTDWSQCRSPSRAMRRWKIGHPQRVREMQRPRKDAFVIAGRLHMHPETAQEFYRLVAEKQNATKSVPAPRSDPNTLRSQEVSVFNPTDLYVGRST